MSRRLWTLRGSRKCSQGGWDGSSSDNDVCFVLFFCHLLILQRGEVTTVNPEIFARILFSRIALKDISVTLNIRARLGKDLLASVNDRVISPFREEFIFTKLREKKPCENFRIFSNLLLCGNPVFLRNPSIQLKVGHHRPTSDAPFKWRFAAWPMMALHWMLAG